MKKWWSTLGLRRLAAWLLDEVLVLASLAVIAPAVLWVFVGMYTGLMLGIFPSSLSEVTFWIGVTWTQVWVFVLYLVLGVLNEVVMVRRSGASLGKFALQLQVVGIGEDASGRLSWRQAWRRYFTSLLCQASFGMGYLSWRGWHDRLAETEVRAKKS